MDIHYLLDVAIKQRASDLHLSTGNPPIIRVDGAIRKSNSAPLTAETMIDFLRAVMSEKEWSQMEDGHDLTFAIDARNGHRFRVSAYQTVDGPSAAFRAIPREPLSLDEIGVPPHVRRLAEMESGLIIVTGAHGMGRTTTVAALTDYINRNFARHILTVEQPIEFRMTSRRSLVNQREIGASAISYPRALASALLSDPNVLVTGELSDFESLDLALRAAETGRLVIMIMSTQSAAQAVDHIITDYPAEHQARVRTRLSASLQGVIAQSLMRRAGGKGRVAAFEVLLGTPAVRNLVREGHIQQLYSMMQMGARYGMQTMAEAIEDLVRSGQIDQEEAIGLLAPSPAEGEGQLGYDEDGDQAAGKFPY